MHVGLLRLFVVVLIANSQATKTINVPRSLTVSRLKAASQVLTVLGTIIARFRRVAMTLSMECNVWPWECDCLVSDGHRSVVECIGC